MKLFSFTHTTLFLAFVLVVLHTSCSSDDDVVSNPPAPTANSDIKNFMYNGMQTFYLYKENVPKLNDPRFPTQDRQAYATFLNDGGTPEQFYESLQDKPRDRFSFLTTNYIELEKQFQGTTKIDGIEFLLSRFARNDDRVLGVVTRTVKGSDAETKNVKRGMLFTEINGQQLTVQNFGDLLFSDNPKTYTWVTGGIVDGSVAVEPTGETTELVPTEITENPVILTKTFDVNGQKVGYLFYDSFVGNFDLQLNEAFGQLKSEGATDLILDLRYNGGGSVRSAIRLASMISGLKEDAVFSREVWNKERQAEIEEQFPERLTNTFVSEIETDGGKVAINALNTKNLYVISTGRTASASELIINGLSPLMKVKQVGDSTSGKHQASITLYDSENFRRQGANPNHTYAIQPLVLRSVNSSGEGNYDDGLFVNGSIEQRESFFDMGTLGDEEEPLLKAALENIATGAKPAAEKSLVRFEVLGESGMNSPIYQHMYK